MLQLSPDVKRSKIKVLLVDDLSQVRRSLRTVLSLADDLEISGEAANGLEAVQLAEQLKPDLALVDVAMPELDGFETTRQLKQRRLARSVIILTIYSDDQTRRQAVRAGADAFVAKENAVETLLETIHQIWGEVSSK
jgi:DNA-binding NarL/FixJ family response regulator